MTKKQKSFVQGAALLGIIGLVCKVIGAFYRIPITNIITTEGIAFYQTAYTVYAFLLVISSAGIPVAISKMVSERVTLGDYKAAHQVFKKAFRSLTIIGVVTSVLMFALSPIISKGLSRPGAEYSFMAIAPSLFLVSVLSAYRGYFQGLNLMAPTAISQFVEQSVKLGVGILAASILIEKGFEYGAAGAMIGVTASELLALLFIMFLYRIKKPDLKRRMRKNVLSHLDDEGSIGRKLLMIALPIIIGACAMPFVQLADTFIVTKSLLGLGYTVSETNSLYGNLTGVINPLINMPAVLSLALAMSLVPAISAAKAKKDQVEVQRTASFGFKLSMLIGLPCAAGFFVLAKPIISLLYPSLGADELATSTVLLQIMSVSVLFLTIIQTMTGVFQGLGRPGIPVINLFIGVTVKIVVSLVAIKVPELNIKGAAIGTAACYAIAGILDIIMIIRLSGIKLRLFSNIIKPVISAAMMGAFVYFFYPVIADVSANFATLASIAIGAVFYGMFVLAIGALRQDEASFIPGGGHLEKAMIKIGVWEKGKTDEQ
ncbi:MAG: polysaccharide biosynthesis protein [Eubacteriales bacterium]